MRDCGWRNSKPVEFFKQAKVNPFKSRKELLTIRVSRANFSTASKRLRQGGEVQGLPEAAECMVRGY